MIDTQTVVSFRFESCRSIAQNMVCGHLSKFTIGIPIVNSIQIPQDHDFGVKFYSSVYWSPWCVPNYPTNYGFSERLWPKVIRKNNRIDLMVIVAPSEWGLTASFNMGTDRFVQEAWDEGVGGCVPGILEIAPKVRGNVIIIMSKGPLKKVLVFHVSLKPKISWHLSYSLDFFYSSQI